jgi:hypothetical protein
MPQTRRAKRAANTPLDRLQASIEGAESALKDLRREVGRDSRERLNDVATTLKSARRNLTRSRQRIIKEMEGIEKSLMKGKKRATSKRATSKRRTKPARASAARSRKTATAKSAAKPRTTKTASRSKAAAKPRARRAAKPKATKARAKARAA